MRLAVLLAFASRAIAYRGCPENSHFGICGAHCPLTCDNFRDPSDSCIFMCSPGCHCDDGYVERDDGSCVKPKDCLYREKAETCGENECFNKCGTNCPLTCDNYNHPPRGCTLDCKTGCECEKGFVRGPDDKCIRPEECPKRSFADKNCVDDPDPGMCRGYFPSYYYDKETQTCKRFIYGGCQGNGNRYRRKSECLANCYKPQTTFESACDQPKVTGPCLALFHNFFFNTKTGQCELFIYGGCGGNDNNFRSQRDCEDTCMK